MTNPHARLTAALAAHQQRHTSDPGGSDCNCGEWHYHWPDSVDHAAHLADVITSLEGVAVVEIRALNRHIASGIQSYAGGESDGYSYHGDGSALEAMRHLSNQAAGLARYITTNLARAAEGGRITDHEFLPVAGHPDDDECTYRSDGTDATYCGEPQGRHGL